MSSRYGSGRFDEDNNGDGVADFEYAGASDSALADAEHRGEASAVSHGMMGMALAGGSGEALARGSAGGWTPEYKDQDGLNALKLSTNSNGTDDFCGTQGNVCSANFGADFMRLDLGRPALVAGVVTAPGLSTLTYSTEL